MRQWFEFVKSIHWKNGFEVSVISYKFGTVLKIIQFL